MSDDHAMFEKIVSFEGYENKHLVMEIAALEIVDEFCRFVDGPWLIARNTMRWRAQLPDTALVECECCRSFVSLPLPLGDQWLCLDCEPLVRADLTFPEVRRRLGFSSWWEPGDWD